MRIIRAKAPSHVQFGRRLNPVPINEGLHDVGALQEELLEYTHVLLGREDSPIDSPYLSLMEVANAYHARACEIEMMILWEEQDEASPVVRGHPLYRFRTGQLRTFIEMARKMIDVGSRRLTQEELVTYQRRDAGER